MKTTDKDTVTAKTITLDGNTACARVAYATNEVIAVYPITPSTSMGEAADVYAAKGEPNIWGTVPRVSELQSEAGVAGTVHGALTTGALTTTFTASQGLLLMVPNMYKIAGELAPTVFHIAARSLATHALSIFGDHSDVMSVRSTGWAMLCASNVQEAQDFALISQAATLKSRVPFIHFFDGFRTSHEIRKINALGPDVMHAMLPGELVQQHRARGLSPDHPSIRGTAQNPDVFFQSREAANPYYKATPGIVQDAFDQFAELTGRSYKLFEYSGHPEAENVVIIMGSGAETIEETTEALVAKGERVGLLKVRLYRPFDGEAIVNALPRSVKRICVMDRTKEPGAGGEPLYLDVQSALMEAVSEDRLPMDALPRVVGGRYGLGSKEFNPQMAKAIINNVSTEKPRNHFTVGILDDVSMTSIDPEYGYLPPREGVLQAQLYGLGSDGTVGSAKNIIKIVGDRTELHPQGYFVYDSKKSGSLTVSHLRFAPGVLKSAYLVGRADIVVCNAYPFLERYPVVDDLKPGGTFLLNAPCDTADVWDHIPSNVQQHLIDKQAKIYAINAYDLAETLGLKGRINMIMMTAFLSISGLIKKEKVLDYVLSAVRATYSKKGPKVIQINCDAASQTLDHLHEIPLGDAITGPAPVDRGMPEGTPDFISNVTRELIAGRGDRLPVSAMPADGTYPTGTARYEKRNIAENIPVWQEDICIQCGRCALVCPHAAIRTKIVKAIPGDSAVKALPAKGGKDVAELLFTLQTSPQDCTGCTLCVEICPAMEKDEEGKKTGRRAINMAHKEEVFEVEEERWNAFENLPNFIPDRFDRFSLKGSQLHQPLFEFSGACAGCGETPYIKLLTQLFGERLLVANATGCSSIFSGNLPTTPYTTLPDGRGPAWSNSLFEDAAEFGYGMKLSSNLRSRYARELLQKYAREQSTHHGHADPDRPDSPEWAAGFANPVAQILDPHTTEPEVLHALVGEVKAELIEDGTPVARELLSVIDALVTKSHWIIGGDGWAYDIGFGGLDHVLASGENVNILVLDTGVYSNTGGQASKATPMGAIAGFAAGGKAQSRKDLGQIAMGYKNAYVAQVALMADPNQTIKAIREAEAHNGPSIIIAYATCIAHGIDMSKSIEIYKNAVETGFWPLYRRNPANVAAGKPALSLDSKEPAGDLELFFKGENRFASLWRSHPDTALTLLEESRANIKRNYKELARKAKK